MSAKTETEVTIDNKTFTLSGYESREYMQKIAAYVNGKIEDFKKTEAFRRQTLDMQTILIELNIADDYYKAKKVADELESDIEKKDKELYDLKHDMVSANIKLESANDELKDLRNELTECQKKIVRLETELGKK